MRTPISCAGTCSPPCRRRTVIFSAIDLSERRFAAALAHVWPLLAFIAGMLVASHQIRPDGAAGAAFVAAPDDGVQAVVLAIIGFRPRVRGPYLRHRPDLVSRGHPVGLFRNIGDLAYLPVATTGNLMRFLESTYDGVVERRAEARHAVVVYGSPILAFAGGALIGAVASDVWGVRAIWLPAAFLAVTLVLFIVEERG